MRQARRLCLQVAGGAGLGWLAGGLAAQPLGEAATVVDDAGRTVRLARPAQRIVSLAPNLTELVHALGAGDRLVGVDTASHHPRAVVSVPKVGDHARIDVERVVSLRPDVILAWHRASPGRDLAQLESLGLPVAAFEPRALDDVPGIARRLARLMGLDGAAEPMAARWREQLERLRRRYAAQPPVRVFYQVWAQPLLTIGAGHALNEAITLCGGRPLFPTLAGLAPPVSAEAVAAARPEVIVTAVDALGGPLRREPTRAEFAAWQRLDSVPAVRRGLMFVLDGDLVSRSGPRWLDGVEQLCVAIDAARQESTR